MLDVQTLREYGVNYDAGLARVGGNRSLYERLLLMFLKDTSYQNAKTAMEAGDRKALLEAVHTLKGVSGNLDLTALYGASTALVTLLRDPVTQDVSAAFDAFEMAYRRTSEGILLAGGN